MNKESQTVNIPAAITTDMPRLQGALARFPRDRAMWIDGREDASASEMVERYSPAHGVLVTRTPRGQAADAERAIGAARQAFDHGPWPKMSAGERAGVLLRVADAIDRERDLLAHLDCLESGKPIAQARGEVEATADIWRYAAALARTLHGDSYASLGSERLGVVLREPVGVVAIITPWNFPLLIVSQKLPFALAAGCTCVVKPSEMTSASTLHLARLLSEAGLPKGACNVITGFGPEAGAPLATDPRVDMLTFTGSTQIGRAVMAAASASLKKVAMELGGKNPQIVLADADMEAAVDACAFGAYFNAGECCNAGSRILVEGAIAEEFTARLAKKVQQIRIGDPLDPEINIGAIISAGHLGKIEASIAAATKAGAAIRTGGARVAGDGLFMAPTIVDGVTADMAVATEEIFGPVVSVQTIASPEDAIACANASSYGLSAAVWSRNIDVALHVSRQIRAGTVWINTFMDGTPELPFGGYRQSGIGRELGRNAVADFTEEKTLHMHQGPRTAWWLPRV